jgi:hypothetical protein
MRQVYVSVILTPTHMKKVSVASSLKGPHLLIERLQYADGPSPLPRNLVAEVLESDK